MPLVPLVKQRKNACGDAAARCVMGYWERRYPRLSAVGWPNPIDGTDPRVIEALLRKSGLMVSSGEMTVADLRHNLRHLWPVICLVREEEWIGHYVVVTGVLRGKVSFMDPSEGRVEQEPLSVFVGRWQAGDVCRTGAAYRQWGIVARVEQ